MKTILIYFLIIYCMIVQGVCSPREKVKESKKNAIFQYSTLSALLEGVYDGELTIGELRKQGNYGIGTFNALDGELILADHECYKVCSDGKVIKVNDEEKTPFAAICSFSPDTVIQIDRPVNLRELETRIGNAVKKSNLIFAYKITGSFDTVVTRSVPKQEKPYKRLIEAYKQQGVFTYLHQEGMLFGYKFPAYLKDVNMDGFHLHFLSSDKHTGGHLLSCTLIKGEVAVAYIRNYTLQIPDNFHFNQTILTNKKSELLKIEGAGK